MKLWGPTPNVWLYTIFNLFSLTGPNLHTSQKPGGRPKISIIHHNLLENDNINKISEF